MDKNLLKKYFTNSCSDNEVDEILLWFKYSGQSKDGRNMLNQIWHELEGDEKETVDFERVLDRIHHQMNIKDAGKSRKINLTQTIIKLAAALFIPLLLGSLYLYNQLDSYQSNEQVYTNVKSPKGAQTSLELPDGSTVWLNSGSSLKFPAKFANDLRQVELVGEAFFDIVHNPEKPLFVKAGDIQVKVHGTEFNVLAYEEDEKIGVTLKSGSISIQKEVNGKLHHFVKLKPNQHAIYSKKERTLKYSNFKTDKYSAWKEGKMIFVNDSLNVVMKQLEKKFNIETEIRNNERNKYTYTATFSDEKLEDVLRLLKIATPIKYKIEKGRQLEDKSFSKTKVIIY